jgi:hypothetical protein
MIIDIPQGWEKISLYKNFYNQLEDIISFCETYLGKGNIVSYTYYGPGDICSVEESCTDNDILWILEKDFNYTMMYFKNEQDALLFTMRWL